MGWNRLKWSFILLCVINVPWIFDLSIFEPIYERLYIWYTANQTFKEWPHAIQMLAKGTNLTNTNSLTKEDFRMQFDRIGCWNKISIFPVHLTELAKNRNRIIIQILKNVIIFIPIWIYVLKNVVPSKVK